MREVCTFLRVFSYRPGGAKYPTHVFRKRPGITVNAPGHLFLPCKIVSLLGAFTRITIIVVLNAGRTMKAMIKRRSIRLF